MSYFDVTNSYTPSKANRVNDWQNQKNNRNVNNDVTNRNTFSLL